MVMSERQRAAFGVLVIGLGGPGVGEVCRRERRKLAKGQNSIEVDKYKSIKV